MFEPKTKKINGYVHELHHSPKFSEAVMLERSEAFYESMDRRRSVREISNRPVPRQVIENLIKSASTAPSGAHKQPWTFCVVSDPEMKRKIREAAEKEEKENYSSRMSERWKKDLAPLGTNHKKPFIEEAPYLIVLFKKVYEVDEQGEKHNNYYVNESVGIAAGMLLTAIHQCGLVSLTHTPSPMNFLCEVLERPQNERPFLLIPVGLPKEPVYVPQLSRKPLEEVAQFYETKTIEY
jgi:iodotyrosine deiodinase